MARLSNNQIVELLLSWDNDKVIELHNNRCEIFNCMEDYVYQNTEEELTMFLPSNPFDAFVEGLHTGDAYYTSDEYFYINGYGHIISFSDPTEQEWIIDEIVRWLEDDDDRQQAWLELDDEQEEKEE